MTNAQASPAFRAMLRAVMGSRASGAIELFFSYSHRDRDLRDELERHLAVLTRTGVISAWHDRQISAGAEWAGEIDSHLERARIILLLVSADFLSSDYCYDVELRRAMERHASGSARVIPVILRAADWVDAPFGRLNVVPTDARPITSWPNRDEAFLDVARAIKAAAAALASAPPAGAPASVAARTGNYPVAQRQLIEESVRGYVERGALRHAFDRFCAMEPRGYFVVVGAPGYGKTAFASNLIREGRFPHHFIGRAGGRSDPRLILSSLLEQLVARPPETDPRAWSLPDLVASFEQALRDRAASERLVVVIDGLNELGIEVDEAPPFLPLESLPPNVVFVVTSQPDQRLESWTDQLTTIPHAVHTLAPLATAEVRELIKARLPEPPETLVDSIVERAQGSPLYVRAALDASQRDPAFDPFELPAAVEGYFRRATREATEAGLLRDVLGLIAVSRKNLSLAELSELTGVPQRRVHTESIRPVRQFLLENGYRYAFYHQRFHDFVVRDVLFDDELRHYHATMAAWLDRDQLEDSTYRWSALAYHIYMSGDRERLLKTVDTSFLSTKLRRTGYAVLEDVELVARALLDDGDPSVVERSVALIESLRSTIGSTMVDEVASRLRPGGVRAGSKAAIEPVLRTVPGVSLHAALVPKAMVTADFVEVIRLDDRLVIALGDAPSAGLKSAFVARFIAALFRRLVETSRPLQLGPVLDELNRTIAAHEYFERVSMQCVEVRPGEGVMSLVSAGHPYPVVYSARRRVCEVIPIRGPLLHDVERNDAEVHYETRHVEIAPGDVIVLMSDGLTEGGRLDGDAYGYRFTKVIAAQHGSSARSICRAILDDWKAHPRQRDWIDDTTTVVMAVTGTSVSSGDDAD
jgi:hypothetical protein